MLVEKFVFKSPDLEKVGLKHIEMNRLGRYVALAGKNGAGKSRILSELSQCISVRKDAEGNRDRLSDTIKSLQATIEHHSGDSRIKAWQEQIGQTEKTLARFDALSLYHGLKSLIALHFVPKQLNLIDPRQHNPAQQKEHFLRAQDPGLNNFAAHCFSYIQKIQDREWEVTHQRSEHAPSEVAESKTAYEQLCNLLELLLKTKLGRSRDAEAMLFDKPLAEAGLSDGQKVLVQLAVALHAQKEKLENTVFILDEPENHLHPSAVIDFLDRLSEVASNSQFWIATHSIPLLAYVARKEPMSIWYVEEGSVSNGGSHPEKVLGSLLGNEEQIENLHLFTSLPATYAAVNFAVECLTSPKVVGGGQGDKQVRQVGEVISFDESSPLTVLDYGAGKSRLLTGLNEIIRSHGMSVEKVLSYFSFDTDEKDRPESISVMGEFFNDASSRHFTDKDAFFSNKDDSSVDVVVMCNVLHEIPPADWLSLFSSDGLINRCLKDNGYLLVVEDQRIPTGEKAHKFGFLVLNTPHLKTLFGAKEQDIKTEQFREFDYQKDGRLKAHKIAKSLFSRVTSDSRKMAIQALRQTAIDQIHELRKATPNFRNGQLHGFWTQQFANACLWLEEA